MIVCPVFRGSTVAVFGLARSGLASIRALRAGGARVLAWDDHEDRRAAAAALGAEPVAPTASGWAGIAALVLSPGVPLTHPAPHPVVRLAAELGAEVLGDVELLARSCPEATVVAVTGTNGKSTTTALTGHLLQAAGVPVQVGGNIGRAVFDLDPPTAGSTLVLELSSYQIDLTRSLRPAVLVWLNLTPDHLDRHGDLDGYVAAKRRLIEMTPPGAAAVIGVDDAISAGVADLAVASGVRVTRIAVDRHLGAGIAAVDGRLWLDGGGCARLLADLAGIETLRGRHNAQNAAAAVGALLALGHGEAAAVAGLATFPGLAHRMEKVGEFDGVAFVNDSKATNADAAARALASYDTIYWIAGGLAKAGGIDALAPFFPRLRRAFLIGDAALAFAATLEGRVAAEQCGDLATAVAAAADAALGDRVDGATVLLSPACASFDQFRDFEARGDAFRALVADLVAARQAPRRAGGGAA